MLRCDWLLFQAQIHLIGNPVSWGIANMSLVAYQLLACVYLLRRRRGLKDLPDGMCFVPHLFTGQVCLPAADQYVD